MLVLVLVPVLVPVLVALPSDHSFVSVAQLGIAVTRWVGSSELSLLSGLYSKIYQWYDQASSPSPEEDPIKR